jgi:hypothetical protein
MRIYDPRLGRFLSVDPIAKQYPELTPYQFAGNTPIWAVDLDGLEPNFRGSVGEIAQAPVYGHKECGNQTWIMTNEGWSSSATGNQIVDIVEQGPKNSTPRAAWKIGKAAASILGEDRGHGLIIKLLEESGADAIHKVVYGRSLPQNQEGNYEEISLAARLWIVVDILPGEHFIKKTGEEFISKFAKWAWPYTRVKPRKGVLEDVTEAQPKNDAGELLNPYTGEVLKDKDLGHKPGNEWWRRRQMHKDKGHDRETIIEMENDPNLYQWEDRSSNRSHKDEKKD